MAGSLQPGPILDAFGTDRPSQLHEFHTFVKAGVAITTPPWRGAVRQNLRVLFDHQGPQVAVEHLLKPPRGASQLR